MWKFALVFLSLFVAGTATAQDVASDTHRLLEFDSRVGGSIVVSHDANETMRLETALGLRHSGSSDFVAFTGNFATAVAGTLHSHGAGIETYGDGDQRVLVFSGQSAVYIKHLLSITYGYDLVFADPICVIKGGIEDLLNVIAHVAAGTLDVAFTIAEIGALFMYCTLQTAWNVAFEVAQFAGALIVKGVRGAIFFARYAAYQLCEIVRIGARGAIYIAQRAVVGAYRLVGGTLRLIRNILRNLFDGLLNPFGRPCHRVYVY